MISRILPLAATLLAHSLRFRWTGEAIPEHAVIMFWHGKMLPGWYCVRKKEPIALVSQSKDGTLLASVLAFWGYKLARGSTKKSGMEALQNAMMAIRQGQANALVVTPDGPRGPRHVFKRGAFIAAKELGLPLYMMEIYCHSKMLLKSWDKFEVPFPFSKVDVRVIKVNSEEFPTSNREAQEGWLVNTSQAFV